MLEHIKEYSMAPANMPITTNNKNKNSGKRKIVKTKRHLALSEQSAIDTFVTKLNKAIEKKNKNKFNGFWLIISFGMSDYPGSITSPCLSETIETSVKNKFIFEKVYFCDKSKKEIVHRLD